MLDHASTLGVDVGGTKLLAVVREPHGDVHELARLPTTRSFSPAQLREVVHELLARAADAQHPIGAIGIGFPGLVDPKSGTVRSSVIIDDWHDVELGAQLLAATGLPCRIDNDVNMAARDEAARRRSSSSLLFVSAGTGIGGALVFDGKLWTGSGGLAGEIGHIAVNQLGPPCICGRTGCVGQFAGGEAIERALDLEPGHLQLQSKDDPKVERAMAAAGHWLGQAIADVLNLLDLDAVVVGGGLAQVDSYFDAARESAFGLAFPEIVHSCAFERPAGGYRAGAIGASLLARDALGSCP